MQCFIQIIAIQNYKIIRFWTYWIWLKGKFKLISSNIEKTLNGFSLLIC